MGGALELKEVDFGIVLMALGATFQAIGSNYNAVVATEDLFRQT